MVEKNKKRLIVAVVLAALLVASGGTLAWLSASGVLINTFGIGTVEPKVIETLSGDVKSNVSVKNVGTAPAFIRAQIDIYWQDTDGNQLWDAPAENTDYSIVSGDDVSTGGSASGGAWIKGSDGYWYWTGSVTPGVQTGQLIKTVKAMKSTVDQKLVVDISAQAIQSTPDDAVTEAWGCAVSDGRLTPPTSNAKDGE